MSGKKKGWRGRLAAVVEEHRKPFAWGERDCGLFMADAVRAQTGVDFAAGIRGTYNSAIAARAITDGDMGSFVASVLPEIPPASAQYGDIAVVETGDPRWPLAGGVVIGENVAVYTEEGIGTVPLAAAARAFRVG